MPSLKRPLFNGIIQPMHIGIGAPAVASIFTPPDSANVKNPQTFELHLWLLPAFQDPANPTTYLIQATEGPFVGATKIGTVWSGRDVADGYSFGPRPIKILNGYPVRGNVHLTFFAVRAAGVDPWPGGPQLWGYFLPVGQGSKYEQEHRYIGNQPGLEGFNAGVPVMLAATEPPGPGTSEVIHTFEPNRIDEISLAFAPIISPVAPAPGPGFGFAVVSFEDVNNQPLIPGHSVQFQLHSGVSNPAFQGSSPTDPGIAPGHVEQSPYMILGTPFGGNPLLHHLRVQAVAGEDSTLSLGVHGYYIRH